MRPSGKPRTMASELPVAIKPKALALSPTGARRTESGTVIDQKTECAVAIPRREASKSAKLSATADSK